MAVSSPSPASPSSGPRLRTGDGTERHATWLELFFDLVFVVAIAELASTLHGHPSLAGLAGFAALFVPVWWQWIDFSYFADQFDDDGLPMRVTLLVVMFAVLAMAATIPGALHGGQHAFAATMVILRCLMTALYGWAWRGVPASRELAGRYTLSFSIALCLWVASLFVSVPVCYRLWAVALAVEISNGPITYATVKNVPQQASHMDERFGLFVLIVLGETVASVATGVAGTHWQAGSGLCAALAFLVTACFWWLYFGHASTAVIHDALRGTRAALLMSYVYGYGHLPIFAGIAAAGVGLQETIAASAHGQMLSLASRAALLGGMATFLAGLTVTQWAARGSLPLYNWAARGLCIGVCLAGMRWGGGLPPLSLTAGCAAVCGGLTAWQAHVMSSQARRQAPAKQGAS